MMTQKLTKDKIQHCREILHTLSEHCTGFYRPGRYDIGPTDLAILLEVTVENDRDAFSICDNIVHSTWNLRNSNGAVYHPTKSREEYDQDIIVAYILHEKGVVEWSMIESYLDEIDHRFENLNRLESYEYRRVAASIHITNPTVRKRIFDKCGHECSHCGATGDLSIDHIHPVSKGGGDEDDNLQVLCRSCNSKKSNKFPEVQ